MVVEGLLDVGTDIHLDGESRPKFHYVLVDYVARAVGGRVRLNDESSSYGWFSSAEVKNLKMSTGTRDVLMLYFDRHRAPLSGYARRPTGKRSP